MSRKIKGLLLVLAIAGFLAAIYYYLGGTNFQVLNPGGTIAKRERELIIFASLLSLVVVLPVFGLTFFIAWRYRASNHQAKYRPDWDHNRVLEAIWWVVPLALITVLSVVTWRTSHELDPFKPLAAVQKPLTVQVVAMQWKWLFIYPEQNVASLNLMPIPEDRPINLQITAEGPMNSFWVPQLSGQIYAMSGMSTRLHLMAERPGDYKGVSANISGAGFADMKFIVRADSQGEFDDWLRKARQSPRRLTNEEYFNLIRPSTNSAGIVYSSVEAGIYNKAVMKYMMPIGANQPIASESHAHN